MARPAEKARAMFNKWVALKEKGNDDGMPKRQNRRPHLASECEHLADAERFRGQIVREIADLIAKIQNPSLGEHEIRSVNDTINQRMREKYHWNKRVYQLGGLDYNTLERKRRIEEGDTQLDSQYRYYGAAKMLPGVQELLEKEEATRRNQRRKHTDIYKQLTPDYYGWRDEEDGVLLELEQAATKRLRQERFGKVGQPPKPNQQGGIKEYDKDYLEVESQDMIAKIFLEQKKKALIKKYLL